MASRFFGGSRPSKSSKQKAPETVEKPTALPKRSGLPMPPKSSVGPAPQPASASRSTKGALDKPTTSSASSRKTFGFHRTPSVRRVAAKEAGSIVAAAPPVLPKPVSILPEDVLTTDPRTPLRRKSSSRDQRSQYAQSESSSEPRERYTAPSVSHDSEQDPHPGTLLGIPMPPPVCESVMYPSSTAMVMPMEATSNSRMHMYNAHLQMPNLKTPDPPPGSAAGSITPSTRFSESPGNFSRGSTPNSVSSHSPSISQVSKLSSRFRSSASPANSRPPVTRRKGTPKNDDVVDDRGLAAVRESQGSSNSSPTPGSVGTVQPATSETGKKSKRKVPPPTPPLRLSSKRGNNPRSLLPAAQITSPPRSEASERALPTVSAGFVSNTPQAERSSRITKTPEATHKPSSASHPRHASSSSRTQIAPSRPSRDGLPSLDATVSPVIQSNLPYVATTGRTRRESDASRTPASAPASATTSARPSLSRSGSVTSASSQTGIPALASPHLHRLEGSKTYPPTAMRTDLHASPSKRDPSPGSASHSKSPGRFGLFSRLKSPSETSVASPPKLQKLVKKGPAAGTGHEGYGRYSRRGRSTSISTAGSRGQSTSTDRGSVAPPPLSSSRKSSFNSNDGKPELDEFFRDRLEPITIGGGGYIRENRNSKTQLYQTPSEQSSVGSFDQGYSAGPSRQGTPSAYASSLVSSRNASHEALPPSRIALPRQGIQQGERTLAHRRSLHRSQINGGAEGFKVPPPINTGATAPSPAMDTYDSTVSSALQTDNSMMSDVSEGHEGNWLRSKKKKGGRRWNFFRRAQRSPEPAPARQPASSFESDRAMPAQVQNAQEAVPVAYYTLMDDENSRSDQELDDKLREIEGHLNLDSDVGLESEDTQREREPSMLLPPAPLFTGPFDEHTRSNSPKVPLNASPDRQAPENARQPRLQHVGRIPQVISNRDRPGLPHSFSRPFANWSNVDYQDDGFPSTTGPPLVLQTEALAGSDWLPYDKPSSAPVPESAPYPFTAEQEFLRMAPRKDSQLTTGSSSSGVLSLVPFTAVAPTAEDVLSDDEVWNEYDDLIDRVSPPIMPESPGIGEMLMNFPMTSSEVPPLPSDYPTVSASLPDGEYFSAIPVALSCITSGKSAKIKTTKRPPLPPKPADLMPPAVPGLSSGTDSLGTPVSLSDLYSNYANRSSAAKSNPRFSNISATSGSRYSTQTIISESGSFSSIDSPQAKRVTQLMAEKTYNPSSNALRFSSLMTSRWLSFDRVLFSPAQNEVQYARQSRVLVLDGLGNDDWAAYCALTYPDATVYNLSASSRKLNAREGANHESWIPPPNLRRVSHAGFAAPIPFPKGFFTVVVLRFPMADATHAYKNVVSECKRVLKPGGFLEMSILDIDMVNMGNRARRAVRGVKERMAAAHPEINLGPASDIVIKLLGRCGFENLNRCVVGVPLASRNGSGSASGAGTPDAASETVRPKNLKELLAAHDVHPAATGTDLPPTAASTPARMGAVGRWWWSRCYETDVRRGGEPTVWTDTALLAECDERQTSLRLLICYAQKPESVRRRTVSV